MRLALIVAVADKGVIGAEGRLPWHLPADLRLFRERTMGHAIIMGRRTFASIGKPLPGRRNMVLSRDLGFSAAGVEVFPDLVQALASVADDPQPLVIGGAALYEAALPEASRIYLTRVRARVAGDVCFPALDRERWRVLEDVPHPTDARHAHALAFMVLERVASG